MRGFYIGRFQPFHNGHLSVVKEMVNHVDTVIIGIGSAETNYTSDNPFTAGERFSMIENSIKDICNYHIIPIRNINNYALWVKHLSLLLPPFQKVFTGSPLIKTLFEGEKQYDVIEIQKNINISGTEIREKITKKEDWQQYVPTAVKQFLEEINAYKRLNNIDSK